MHINTGSFSVVRGKKVIEAEYTNVCLWCFIDSVDIQLTRKGMEKIAEYRNKK